LLSDIRDFSLESDFFEIFESQGDDLRRHRINYLDFVLGFFEYGKWTLFEFKKLLKEQFLELHFLLLYSQTHPELMVPLFHHG
jgi:hypothetical protein